MASIFVIIVLCVPFAMSLTIQHVEPSVCPAVLCTMEHIPENCRKPQFAMAPDGQTKCRVCDGSWCEDRSMTCPQIECPTFNEIPPDCMKPQYMMGMDGITVCTMCPTNGCESRMFTCPQIQCPMDNLIPGPCRVSQYEIGLDGITLCSMCDKLKDGCDAGEPFPVPPFPVPPFSMPEPPMEPEPLPLR